MSLQRYELDIGGNMNKQPWHGTAGILITMAGRELSKDDLSFLTDVLKKKFKKELVSVEIEYVEGEWGDPADLC